MKLLLTSGGITNKSIANALFSLVGKRLEETTLVFIPTASNVETGDKFWLIDDLLNLKKLNFKSIEITDISAVDEKIWKPSIENADILYFEGGNTYHLMEWLNRSGLTKILPKLLKDKVYVGSSAGSIIAGPSIELAGWKNIDKNIINLKDLSGLSLVPFAIFPHFEKSHTELLEKEVEKISYPVIALSDEQAVLIDGRTKKIVGVGEKRIFNAKEIKNRYKKS